MARGEGETRGAGRDRPKRRVSVQMSAENYDELEELSRALHISHAAVVAQAIARMHHAEPMTSRKKNGNGASE